MNKKKKEKRKKEKIFRILFGIYTLTLVSTAGIALFLLYGSLEEYQEVIDADEHAEMVSRAPQIAFEEYLPGLTAEALMELWFHDHPESFDDAERVEEYWGKRLQASRAYKAADYTPEAPVFVLADEEGIFARFSVSGRELDWNVQTPEFAEQHFFTCTVETLDGNQVYCAGKQIPQERIVRREICYEEPDYADRLTDPVSRVTYEIEVLVPAPEFEVRNGTAYDMQTYSDGQLRYTLKDEEGQPLQEYSGKLVQALLDFYLLGSENISGNMAAALAYVEKGSEAYSIIANSYRSVIWREVIRNTQTELSFAPAIVWADNCVSVDVSYHTVRPNAPDETIADGTYRIFFYDFGDGFHVYDMTLI